MKYKLAIFDMDGTILDTLQDLATATNHALRLNNLPEHSLAEIRSYLGNGLVRLVTLSAPQDADSQLLAKLQQDFSAYYKLHCSDHTGPYAGIVELLDKLRAQGMKTAVVSNKPDFGVQLLVQDHFPHSFDYAVGERQGIKKKPAPDTVSAALAALGISRDEAVYIGDSEVDLETARNAALDEIIVTWGFRDEPYLQSLQPKVLVHSVDELEQRLL